MTTHNTEREYRGEQDNKERFWCSGGRLHPEGSGKGGLLWHSKGSLLQMQKDNGQA